MSLPFEAPLSGGTGEARARADRDARWRHLRRRLAFPLTLFVVTRAGLLACSAIGLRLVPQLYFDPGPTVLTRAPTLAGLCRWDCWWFYRLAREGYTDWVETNFWPLYPLLVGATKHIGIPVEYGLLLWANVAALAAYVVIYRIFEEMEGVHAAQWGLAMFALGPFAYFHAAGYPESLTLFFSALALFFTIHRRHFAAGTALGFGLLSRHITIFAGPALLVSYLRERGLHPRALFRSSMVGLFIPLLFGGMYLVYCKQRFGNALAPFEARAAGWGEGSWYGIRQMLAAPEVAPLDYLYLASCVIPSIGAIALLTRSRWLELGAYACTLMIVVLLIGAWGLGRYAASCWPAFLPVGVFLSRRRHLAIAAVAMSALLQGLLFFLWSHQYKML
jgi:hypothetical protein